MLGISKGKETLLDDIVMIDIMVSLAAISSYAELIFGKIGYFGFQR